MPVKDFRKISITWGRLFRCGGGGGGGGGGGVQNDNIMARKNENW